MGKFAQCYDLPGGEQLLAFVFLDQDRGPVVNYATEVNGHIAAAEIEILSEEEQKNPSLFLATMEEARNTLANYDNDTVLNFRRMLVADHKRR